MGANFSTGNNVAVWCEKPVYYAGDVVQGYVFLNVHDSFAARSVNVEVSRQPAYPCNRAYAVLS